jgi:hypothetical protein
MSMASIAGYLRLALVLAGWTAAAVAQDAAAPMPPVVPPPVVAPSATGLATPATPDTALEAFVVRTVPVDVTAANVNEARERGLTQGRVAAFRRLTERMVARENLTAVTAPPVSQVIDMIQEFSIANERASAVRYLAELTVRFDPNAVRTYFRGQGVPFAETASRPMLVVPAVQADPAAPPQVWGDGDPWRDAWARLDARDGLIPLVVPLGDLDDIATLTGEQVLTQDQDAFTRLATKYQAAGVVIAALTASADAPGTWTVVLNEWRSNGATWSGQVPAGTLSDPPSVEVLARVVAETVAAIDDAWKRRNMLQFGQGGRLTALAPLTSLQDWLRIKGLLAQVPVVERVELQAISKTTAQAIISYAGEAAQLQFAVGQYGLDLSRDGEMWLLRAAAGVRIVPAPGAAPPVSAPAQGVE